MSETPPTMSRGTTFHLFSVPSQEQEAISVLLSLHRAKTLEQRRTWIREVEAQGRSVSSQKGVYSLLWEGTWVRLPDKRCEHCHHLHRLDDFITTRGFEHPWCSGCRKTFPVEAERARARRDYLIKQGRQQTPLSREVRCAGPQCSQVLTSRQVLLKQRYCSRHCWYASRREQTGQEASKR